MVFNHFHMHRTQTSPMGDGEDQEEFLCDLSLHSDLLMPCTPANAVELHSNSQPGEMLYKAEMYCIFVIKMVACHFNHSINCGIFPFMLLVQLVFFCS